MCDCALGVIGARCVAIVCVCCTLLYTLPSLFSFLIVPDNPTNYFVDVWLILRPRPLVRCLEV